MTAPTYPSSALVADTQPNGYKIWNKLRSDALYLGAGQVEPADTIQSVPLGSMLGRYSHNVYPEYLATNRIRVPYSTTQPPTLVVNGYMLKATADVDLPASSFSGAAATWYIFANRAAGSTTFTLTVNTSSTEAADQRLIGQCYWDGANLSQTGITAEELQPTPPGTVIQTVNFQTGALATGSTVLPGDDTIPQNTEGDQYMSLAITPTNVNNTLIIQVVGVLGSSGPTLAMALFQDSVANALAAVQHASGGGWVFPVDLSHKMIAGTLSTITFKVRAGPTSAATLTFNGSAGARLMGGVMASSITIMEIQA